MSTSVNLASNVTTTGITTPVRVPFSRLYVVQIAVTDGTSVTALEMTLDGNAWWTALSQEDISTTGGVQVYRIVDTPVLQMRLNVTDIDGTGATVRADAVVMS
jgi:hypothetical protein